MELINASCPICHSRGIKSALVIRTNTNNGEKFIGCSRFPTCKYTAGLDEWGRARADSTWRKSGISVAIAGDATKDFPISGIDLVEMLANVLDEICRLLFEYFCEQKDNGNPRYTGGQFDRFWLNSCDDDNVIGPSDILSLLLLSVEIDPNASRAILLSSWSEVVKQRLSTVPNDISITDADSEKFLKLSRGFDSETFELWRSLHLPASEIQSRYGYKPERGFADTTVSKLLARKRPNLFPVVDKVVRRKLNFPLAGLDNDPFDSADQVYRYFWALFHNYGVNGVISEALKRFHEKYPEGCDIDSVSRLRVLDVILWMAPESWFTRLM